LATSQDLWTQEEHEARLKAQERGLCNRSSAYYRSPQWILQEARKYRVIPIGTLITFLALVAVGLAILIPLSNRSENFAKDAALSEAEDAAAWFAKETTHNHLWLVRQLQIQQLQRQQLPLHGRIPHPAQTMSL